LAKLIQAHRCIKDFESFAGLLREALKLANEVASRKGSVRLSL